MAYFVSQKELAWMDAVVPESGVATMYSSVVEYDAVLRAHCRFSEVASALTGGMVRRASREVSMARVDFEFLTNLGTLPDGRGSV
jgi:hypothetical protein